MRNCSKCGTVISAAVSQLFLIGWCVFLMHRCSYIDMVWSAVRSMGTAERKSKRAFPSEVLGEQLHWNEAQDRWFPVLEEKDKRREWRRDFERRGNQLLCLAHRTGGFQIPNNCWQKIRRQFVQPHNWSAHAAQSAHANCGYRRAERLKLPLNSQSLFYFFLFCINGRLGPRWSFKQGFKLSWCLQIGLEEAVNKTRSSLLMGRPCCTT